MCLLQNAVQQRKPLSEIKKAAALVTTACHKVSSKLFVFALLLCSTILTPTLHAQEGDPWPPTGSESPPRFAHLTTSDGLANAHVEVIFQDSQGFMWFGTRDGLNRYDGYRFTTYRNDPADPNSLSGNLITDIIENSQGKLWFATNNGVSIFEPRLERFNQAAIDLAPSSRIFSLLEDSQGHIWLGANDDQLRCLDPVTGDVSVYPLPADMPRGPGSQVWDMIEDRVGNLWLAASSGVIRFDPHAAQFTRYAVLDDPGEIRALYEDETGHIWFDGSSLHKLDPATENITTLQLPLGPVPIADMLVDRNRQVWLATLQGLFRFDLQAKEFNGYFTHQPSVPSSLNSSRTFSLFEDKAGLLWIGTEDAGLNLFDPRQSQFARYQHDPDNPSSLGATRVTAIVGDESGVLWLGTDNILNHFDPVTGRIDHYYPATPTGPDPFGIKTLLRDQDGRVWFGLGNQLQRFDPQDGQFTAYDLPGQIDGLPNPFTSIYRDETGVLWLGRQRQGFLLFDPHIETFQPPPDGIDLENVWVIHGDPGGVLWLTSPRTLVRFDPRNERIDSYQASFAPVNALYRDQSGNLWIAAQDGLYRFDPSTSSGQVPATANFTRYTDRDGLPSSNVLAILADEVGNLWLSTSQGLARFDPQSETFHAYDVDDGLAGDEFVAGAAWQDPSGRMYFGGEQGLTAFDPDQIEDNAYQPLLVLTQIRLFNEPLAIGGDSPLSQAINFTDHLTLNHDQDVISFEFAALSYASPHKNRYRYKLEGFEDEWNEVGSDRRFATYTNLPAGDYVFRVQGTNDSGVWSAHKVALALTVLPPWWETVWFRGGLFLLIVALVGGGTYWRIDSIRRRNVELEVQVTARTQELAEEKTHVEAARAMLWMVLNNIDALIYVADLETYEILFANAQLKQVFGEVEGCICWQALQEGQTGQCDFCSNPALLDERGQPRGIHRWQFENTRNGRWYTVADSAIEWINGRLVRLSMSADITAYKQAESKLLAQQRLTAALDERERIGRELHDDLGQAMSYIGVQLQTALAVLEQRRMTQLKAVLTQLAQVAQETNDDVRQHILGIRTAAPSPASRTFPPETDAAAKLPLDFFAALDQYLHVIYERHNLDVQVSRPHDLQSSPFSPEVETQLLRIIQEALTNVRKHAGVSAARLIFTLHVDEVQVIIEDEGHRFDASQRISESANQRDRQYAARNTEHFGLFIMRERAEIVGGSLEMRSAPSEGTRIIVRMPRALLPLSGEMPDRTVRVLLVDDHPLYLEGLRTLLSTRGLHVVGEANDGLEAVEKARTLRPDLILMDVQMPQCDGIEATRRIKAELPEIKIVMLTMTAEGDTLFEALKSGASGYLLKSLNGSQFFSLLNKAMWGETVLSPDLATRMLTEFVERDVQPPAPALDLPPEEKAPVLTARQREILELVAQGLSNKEIAQALSVSDNTIKYHVSQILERLQLTSRYELAQYVQDQD